MALGHEFLPIDDQRHHCRVQESRGSRHGGLLAVEGILILLREDAVEVDPRYERSCEVDELVIELYRWLVELGVHVVHVPKAHFFAAMETSPDWTREEGDLVGGT